MSGRSPHSSISVLLPVHAGASTAALRECLTSVACQTLLPDEVVLVADGPLTEQQKQLISEFSREFGEFKLVRLPVNVGSGGANQAGLLKATSEWIAKVDSDDICLPDRLKISLEYAQRDHLDVVGSSMLEFGRTRDEIRGIRKNPTGHEAIIARMRWNSPINHPTAFYRRNMAVAAGGYRTDMRFMQDYDFFARLMKAGARMGNIDAPLVMFRADAGVFRRRRSIRMLRYEWLLQQNLRRYGIVGHIGAIRNFALRSALRLMPTYVLQCVYRTVYYRSPRRRLAESPEGM